MSKRSDEEMLYDQSSIDAIEAGVRAGRRAGMAEALRWVVERNDVCGRKQHLNGAVCPVYWGTAIHSYCNHCWATARLEESDATT